MGTDPMAKDVESQTLKKNLKEAEIQTDPKKRTSKMSKLKKRDESPDEEECDHSPDREDLRKPKKKDHNRDKCAVCIEKRARRELKKLEKLRNT